MSKKDKITGILRDEFSNETYDKVSINQIIKKAGIPRGSFYQYFTDKTDAFLYIFEIVSYELIEKSSKRQDHKGDLFEAVIDLCSDFYDQMHVAVEYKVIKHVMIYTVSTMIQSNTPNAEETYHKISRKLLEVFDLSYFAIDAEELSEYIHLILVMVLRSMNEAENKNLSKDVFISLLRKRLNYLR